MRHALSVLILVLLVGIVNTSHAQENLLSSIEQFPTSFIDGVTKKINKLQNKTQKTTEKLLLQLQKQEQKLLKKVKKIDSLAYQQLAKGEQEYQQLYQKISGKIDTSFLANNANISQLTEYIPYLDTLKTSLAFLKNNPLLKLSELKKLKEAQQMIAGLQNKLEITNRIKEELQQRKQLLKEQLEKLGFTKQLKSINKKLYYYQAQLQEYKNILQDPKKLEQKALSLLRENKTFQSFMQKHSMLAQLFRMPDSYDNITNLQSLEGLQTRVQVQQILNQRIGGVGLSNTANVNPQQYIQQQIQQAQTQLNQLKDKLNKFGGSSSEIEMPDFKPNSQKTKTFLQRIEYGINFQTHGNNTYLPTTTDWGVNIGYKLNDKSVVGIGGSYKLGLGTGWKNIRLTHQGIGLRSYIDIKLKGSFWLSGGYEQNYLQEFKKLSEISNVKLWQQSGLIGLTKKYKIGKKTANTQLLWDFLSSQQVPRSQAVKFRVGWSF